MLALRLSEGLIFDSFIEKYGKGPINGLHERLEYYDALGYGNLSENRFNLTEKGFLISNTIISDLISLL